MATTLQEETKSTYQPFGVVSQALAAFADYEDDMVANAGSIITEAEERRAYDLLAKILAELAPLAHRKNDQPALVSFEIDHMLLVFQLGPTPDDDHYLLSFLGVPVSTPIRSFVALGSALNNSLVIIENASAYAGEAWREFAGIED